MKSRSDIKLTRASDLPNEFVAICNAVHAKRPRAVIDHILKHGLITNEELKDLYGYDHPPRAIRDVRESGIPLVTHIIVSESTGRRGGAYTFDDPANIRFGRIGGRRAFSKSFRDAVLDHYDFREALTGESLEGRHLQIDHRVPYEVAGDSDGSTVNDFMLLDGSSQRLKSWSCEHCENFLTLREPEICHTCYWAHPEKYEHVAMIQKRRLEIEWSGQEISGYDKLKQRAQSEAVPIQRLAKKLLSK